ncbi:hypothetical protein EDD11_009952 [Mortierella claussenii]|nr:hypothetical protein EDD11_009952 [Mortierella claussenii]
MPPSKKSAPSASASRNAAAKSKSSPYNKDSSKSAGRGSGAPNSAKKTHAQPSKPNQARNKHLNTNLTSELDSLLGDLNSQLQRKKTKKDARSGLNASCGISESEEKLNAAQAKHESLQQDMMNALDGISALGNLTSASAVPQAIFRPGHQGIQRQHQTLNTAAVTIVDILAERPEFSKLLELVQKDKDLTDLLADAGTQACSTLFAPTNDAFDSVSDIDYPTRDVLMYHVADHVYNSSRLRQKQVIKSLYESKGLDNAAQYLRISLDKPCIPSSIRRKYWGDEPVWIASGQNAPENHEDGEPGLYINRAKVTVPDLKAQSGSIVHGVDRIIRPPGETILDEVERRNMHFTYLIKAWSETGVDAHIRDGKTLPKKLLKWLFSNRGREHLKIFSMYQVGNRALYTPEILNKTHDDGTPGDDYHEIVLQTLLHSAKYELRIQAKSKLSGGMGEEDINHRLINYKPRGLTDLMPTLLGNPESDKSDDKKGHCHPHHRHPYRGGKHHRDHPHHNHPHPHPHPHPQPSPQPSPHPHPQPSPRRDEIVVNKKARILQGYENWVAGNGVIHVVDRVLMPPRSEGCEKMSAIECSAWETMWDLSNQGLDDGVDDALAWSEDLTLFDAEEDMEQLADTEQHPLWNMDETYFEA